MAMTGAGSVDEYIAQQPAETQEVLSKLRKVVNDAAPEAEEIINYGIPTLSYHGNVIHYAAYKAHVGFYPTPSGIDEFRTELEQYELSKGTVRFPLGTPLPYDLIRRITQFRMALNREKVEAKKKVKK